MKVLLIDDQEDILRIAELSLRTVGRMEVEVARSATEGLERARRAPPDAILMDMMMPEMDGLTALGLLRGVPELADVPVVFMTARVQREEIAGYLQAGAIGVIRKPFNPMGLAEELKALLAGAGRG